MHVQFDSLNGTKESTMQKRGVDDRLNLSSLKGQKVTGSESSGEVVQVRVVFTC